MIPDWIFRPRTTSKVDLLGDIYWHALTPAYLQLMYKRGAMGKPVNAARSRRSPVEDGTEGIVSADLFQKDPSGSE